MEENNRKGPGIFYAVVGVATLVVAIIGATFAYFSASAEGDTTTIQGGTNNTIGGALTVDVTRLNLSPSPAPASDSLVPADFGSNKAAADFVAADVNRALTAKCVSGGYTGCHVWKIVATTTQNVDHANLKLHLGLNTDMTDKSKWSYVVYSGTDSAATALGSKGTITGTFTAADTTIDIHNNGALTTTAGATYYVMVFLNNEDNSQNTASDPKNATGSYTGSVALEALGGQVKASFAA